MNRFGIIPKLTSGKWHLILEVSSPINLSVNKGIAKQYATTDDAIEKKSGYGPGLFVNWQRYM